MAKKKPNLTPKQELFCREYVVDMNATQAAIRAGYSKKTATPTASRLLTYVNIQNRVKELKEQKCSKIELSVESVMNGILDTQRRAKEDDNYNAELKAADMLARHVGAYEKDNEQKGQTITDIMAIVTGK